MRKLEEIFCRLTNAELNQAFLDYKMLAYCIDAHAVDMDEVLKSYRALYEML